MGLPQAKSINGEGRKMVTKIAVIVVMLVVAILFLSKYIGHKGD